MTWLIYWFTTKAALATTIGQQKVELSRLKYQHNRLLALSKSLADSVVIADLGTRCCYSSEWTKHYSNVVKLTKCIKEMKDE